jgi:hypothetical protein
MNELPPTLFHGELTPWLAEAASITTGARRRDYGRPLLNHLRIAIRWSNFLDFAITPDKVVAMMVDMKLARQQQTPKDDNFIDILGYSACLSDMHEQLRGMGYEDGIYIFKGMSVSGMQLLYERVLREHNEEMESNVSIEIGDRFNWQVERDALMKEMDVLGDVDTVKSFLK